MLVCVRVYVSERERESVYICMFLCVCETVMCVCDWLGVSVSPG